MKRFLKAFGILFVVVLAGFGFAGCKKDKYNYNDFVDNKVELVLTHEVSLTMKDYTVDDFSDVGCIEIKFFNEYDWKQYIENDVELPNNYRKIYILILDKHSKKNVLEVVRILKARADVDYAGTIGFVHGA